uniref:Thioredoxin domain-containing protein n=1 Tax=Trichuris muris TaxID=70415 RepID=A0A5S6QEY5_TRIMR
MVWKSCTKTEEIYDVVKTANEKMTVLVLFNGSPSEPLMCRTVVEELEYKYSHVNFVLVDVNAFPQVNAIEAFKSTDEPTFAVYMRKAKVASIPCSEVKKMEKTIQTLTGRDVAKARLPRRECESRHIKRSS